MWFMPVNVCDMLSDRLMRWMYISDRTRSLHLCSHLHSFSWLCSPLHTHTLSLIHTYLHTFTLIHIPIHVHFFYTSRFTYTHIITTSNKHLITHTHTLTLLYTYTYMHSLRHKINIMLHILKHGYIFTQELFNIYIL